LLKQELHTRLRISPWTVLTASQQSRTVYPTRLRCQ